MSFDEHLRARRDAKVAEHQMRTEFVVLVVIAAVSVLALFFLEPILEPPLQVLPRPE